MKVAIEYDDFSAVNHNLVVLERMKEHLPNLKVTLFTVPFEIRFCSNLQDSAPLVLPKFKPFVKAINSLDWIEIALHGLTHAPMEFAELSYEGAMKRITVGMKMFENAGITNFAKIFKAPQWALSREAKRAAQDMGFVVLEDNYYNWNLANDEPNADAKEPFIMHGHVQETMGNGMEESMHRVLRLSPDTEFLFLSDIFKTKKGEYDYYNQTNKS
jgi:hypothetical protein